MMIAPAPDSKPKPKPKPVAPSPSLVTRLSWMALIWAGSVAGLAVVAYAIKWAVRPV